MHHPWSDGSSTYTPVEAGPFAALTRAKACPALTAPPGVVKLVGGVQSVRGEVALGPLSGEP